MNTNVLVSAGIRPGGAPATLVMDWVCASHLIAANLVEFGGGNDNASLGWEWHASVSRFAHEAHLKEQRAYKTGIVSLKYECASAKQMNKSL